MLNGNDLGLKARHRALRVIAEKLMGHVDLRASYNDLHAALCATLTFDQDMWLSETLDMVEAIAAAEVNPNRWAEDGPPLPVLTQSEIDVQTDETVRAAFEADDAPAALGPRI